MISVTIDGVIQEAQAGERLIDVINRSASKGPQVCYHPQLGPIQTCDRCMVKITFNGGFDTMPALAADCFGSTNIGPNCALMRNI